MNQKLIEKDYINDLQEIKETIKENRNKTLIVVNAAMNILSEGLRNISAGTVDYTDGADVRPFQGQFAKKSEAHKSLVCG